MKTIQYILITIILLVMSKAYGQLNPMGSIYFQNEYLANPAMAGIGHGWEVNGAYKVQWTAIDGAPSMQTLTATYGLPGKRIGFGLNFYRENAGVIRRTSVKGTYAYHIPLNDNHCFLDFGITSSIMNEWIDFNKVVGDPDDQNLHLFNVRPLYIEGDFGMSYRSEFLTVQGSLSNVKQLFNKDLKRNGIDRSLYMGAVSYKFFTEGLTIEPKVMYRGVENYKGILDVGAQVGCYKDKLTMNALYHSTNAATFGVGTFYQNQLRILCFYTTDTSDLGKYGNGEFEIALQYHFK
ncbi:PorP/SprF family type IX secretion system membrane protein [Chryseobacterium sp. MEBOG07]|uniref:PorP/SprF family type IX secretion system membrane protein n=1 Tax=Chryseobacterium sp. MEBOG07 TaxID=2879939 RepID=UPI001F316C3F|nr:PorP/SprF family type IX secretion system membrane protein [Chryseobacterium sp. MEBOG07]UKB78616.1 PorP/SprF family type IX secretion system membrane protein [Chryseobacterium sp. MEBOG07]